MSVSSPPSLRSLTSGQEADARTQAFRAFEKEFETHAPPPEPQVNDLFQDNPWVVAVITRTMGYIPLLLALIMAASIIISSDKTMRALHDSVAMREWLWGGWTVFVTVCAVVMLEGGLVYAEFGQVRDMLSKGLRRRVWNLKDMRRAIQVRLGNVEPLDYHEMPDPTLRFYSRFMFVLVLLANIYGVTYAYLGGGHSTDLASMSTVKLIEFGLFFIVGIGGALSLRLIGAQMAHMSFDLYAQKRELLKAELLREWRAELERAYTRVRDEWEAQALHRKFLQVNRLPLDSESPYLLLAEPAGDGEVQLDAVPLALSSTASRTGWQPGSRLGNGSQ